MDTAHIEKRAAELGIDDARFTKRSHVLTGKWRLEDMTDDDILEVNDWLDFVEEHEKVAAAPKHIYITGVPGVGKTTEGQRLSKETGLPLISLDGIKAKNTAGARQFIKKNLDTPHIIEGTQILGFRPRDLKGHKVYLIEEPKSVVVDRLVRRGWNDESGKRLRGEKHRARFETLYDEMAGHAEAFKDANSPTTMLAEIEKKAAHAKSRLKQRAPHVPPADLDRIEAMAATLNLDPLRTYHTRLHGGGYAVLAPVGKPGRVKHVVKTVFSHGSKPPGTRLPALPRLEKKASRTFTDRDQTYDVEKLWGSSGKPERISPDELLKSTGRTWGSGKSRFGWKDVLSNPKKYPDHIKRIDTADLKQPILVHNGIVVDGIHRLVRAKREGKKLLAINLSKSDMEGALTKKAFTDELEKKAVNAAWVASRLGPGFETAVGKRILNVSRSDPSHALGLVEASMYPQLSRIEAMVNSRAAKEMASRADPKVYAESLLKQQQLRGLRRGPARVELHPESVEALKPWPSLNPVPAPLEYIPQSEWSALGREMRDRFLGSSSGLAAHMSTPGKIALASDLTSGAFTDELEKSAGFKDTFERLKKKVSAFDVGAALATAGLAGLTAADIRRGGFRGRGAHPEVVRDLLKVVSGLPRSRVRSAVRRLTPDDIPAIGVVTNKAQLRDLVEHRMSLIELPGPLKNLTARERNAIVDEGTAKVWAQIEQGNAMAYAGKRTRPTIVASPKAPESIVAHEVGHITDYYRGGPNARAFNEMDAVLFGSAMDRAKAVASRTTARVLHPHHKKTIMAPEQAAWGLVPESAERAVVMPSALKTYDTGFYYGRAPLALGASVATPTAWAAVRGGEALLDRRKKKKLEKSAAASPTIIGELLRRSGRVGASRKYDIGTGVLGERLRKVLTKEYGPSWSRIIPRKASRGLAGVVAKHPELAPMLAFPGLPPGGPLVYAAPKIGMQKALGVRKRGDLERLLLRLAEKTGRVPGIPSRGALTSGLLGSAGVGGLAMGGLASHNIPQLTYHGDGTQ